MAIHRGDRSGIYDVDAFLAGADTLTPIESNEIGDVAGKRIAHLQCHFGLDSLALARRGGEVSGLDFSPEAIALARELAGQAGLTADFVCGNVYDAGTLLPAAAFDLVYVSWGAIIWLPDIEAWAEVVGGLLAPGGQLYLADCHPVMGQLEEKDGALVFAYPARSQGAAGALAFNDGISYAGDGQKLANAAQFEWLHPLADIIGALQAAGLQLEFLNEHDRLPWPAVRP